MARPRTSTRTRTRRPDRGDVRLIKMAQLAELSGVPGATIKHYMREGLLGGPARRTSRNMAYYDARLAERVKVIKELQSERFLPLKVIGALLEPSPSPRLRPDLDRAERRQLGELAPVVRGGFAAGTGVDRMTGATAAKTRADVLATMPIAASELDLLAAIRLVTLDDSGAYSGVDLELLQLLADIRRSGLGEIFPLSLVEPYVAAVRQLIRFEIDLFRRRVLEGGIKLPRSIPEVTTEAVEIGQRLLVGLRAKLLPPELEALALDL